MRFFDFEDRMISSPVFTSKEVKSVFFAERNILVQIAFWVKKGYIRRVEKGVYLLAKKEKEIDPMALAGKIYAPSYLSLEFALNYYGIIPDIPGMYTSVTARKTKNFSNVFGKYHFYTVKPELFTGYTARELRGTFFDIATPEKALMDFLYLHQKKLIAKNDFWREMRIDEDFNFDKKSIESYKTLFNNKKVSTLVESVLEYQKYAR